MRLVIELPDELIDDVRYAFQQQDQPADDEQLGAVSLAYLLDAAARVRESEARSTTVEPEQRVASLRSAIALRGAIPGR